MKTREKVIISAIIFVGGLVLNLFFSSALHYILSRQTDVLRLIPIGECLSSVFGNRQHMTLFLCLQGFIAILCVMFFLTNQRPYQSDLVQITPDITTPVPVGQHQHGSARWLTDAEKDKVFRSFKLNPHDHALRYLIKHGRDDLEDGKEAREKPPDVECPGQVSEEQAHSREPEPKEAPAFSVPGAGVVLGMKKEG